jgi:hypothetical protein
MNGSKLKWSVKIKSWLFGIKAGGVKAAVVSESERYRHVRVHGPAYGSLRARRI